MMPVYRPGFFCDVFAMPDGRFGQVTTEGPTVRVFVGTNDWPMYTSNAPEPLMFCRCAIVGLDVYSIHQGHDSGRAWLMVFGATPKDLGPTFGVQPVAIDSTYAYVVRSGVNYDRIRLADGQVDTLTSPVPGSSQGISDIAPDGTLWWADVHRTLVVEGLTLTYPNVRGDLAVGQADPPQIAGVFLGKWITPFEGDGFEPHLSQAGGRFAVCARTPKGAAYLEGPPFPPYLGRVPGPVHQQGDTVEVPDKSAFARAFLGPRLGLAGSLDATRAKSFAAVRAGAVELAKEDPNWGLLAKPAGDNVDGFAADIWLYKISKTEAQVVDVVGNAEGDGGQSPVPGWSVKDIRPIEQWRAPGTAPDKPPVDKPSGLDEAAVKRIVAEAIDAAKAEQRADLAKLSDRIDGIQSLTPEALNIYLKAAIAVELGNYEVNGKTERDRLGLQHVVKLGISRRQP